MNPNNPFEQNNTNNPVNEPASSPQTAPEPVPEQTPAPQPEAPTMAAPQPVEVPASAPVLAPIPAPQSPVVQPQQPIYPQPAPGPLPSFPAEPQKSKKGLIIGLVAGGVTLLLLVIVGITVFLMMMGVSKADYAKANETLNDAKTSYNKMSTVYLNPTSSTETELQNGLDRIKDARTLFNAKFTELGTMKAVMNDRDVNNLYIKAELQKKEFDKAGDAVIEANSQIAPVMMDFSKTVSTSVSSSEIAEFRKKLTAIQELKDDNNKRFIEEFGNALDKLVPLADKVQAGRKNFRKYDSKAVTEYYDTVSSLTTIVRDWQSNLTKLADDGEISDEMNALSKELLNKSLGKN